MLTQAESQTLAAKINITPAQMNQNLGSIQPPGQKPVPDQQHRNTKKPFQTKKGDAKDALWCDFCQKHKHTKETIWKIHGRLPTLSQNHVMTLLHLGESTQPSISQLSVLPPSYVGEKSVLEQLKERL